MQFAVNYSGDHLRLAHGQFESFALHHFNQDRELKFTTTLNFPGVRTLGGKNTNRDVTNRFSLQTLFHHVGGQFISTTTTSEGRCIDTNCHRD